MNNITFSLHWVNNYIIYLKAKFNYNVIEILYYYTYILHDSHFYTIFDLSSHQIKKSRFMANLHYS